MMFNIDGKPIAILGSIAFIVTVFLFMIFSDDIESIKTKKNYPRIIFSIIWFIFMIYCAVCATIAGKNKGSKSIISPYATEYIIALQDSNNTNGKFYFRYGYIETSLYLNYIVDIGDNKYVPNSIPFDQVTIRYTKDKPKIEWYKERSTSSIFYKDTTKYYLYIPEGTVMNDIIIDLK